MGFGEQHFAGVTPEGRVMVCGSNSVGQLGLGPLVEECRSAPCRVHALDNAGGEIAATGVACGGSHTVVMCATGLLACGDNASGQLGLGPTPLCCWLLSPVPALAEVVVAQVACGRSHTLCVTSQSQVLSWGGNSCGQLGLGDTRTRPSPACVTALWALPVVSLAAGAAHSAAITASGSMFVWGSNSSGQLGIPADAEHAGRAAASAPTPTRAVRKRTNEDFLTAMTEMGITRAHAELALQETGGVGVEVAAEWLFTAPEHLLQTMHSQDSTGGGGAFGAAAQGVAGTECLNVTEPRRVPLQNVRQASAGDEHTLAVTDDGVFSWGGGAWGALGHCDWEDTQLPTKVLRLEGLDIHKVSAGSHHSLFLTASGEVYRCGGREPSPVEQPQKPPPPSPPPPPPPPPSSSSSSSPITTSAPHPRASGLTVRTTLQPLHHSRSASCSPMLVPIPQQPAGALPQQITEVPGGAPRRQGSHVFIHDVFAGAACSGMLTHGGSDFPAPRYSCDLLQRLEDALAQAELVQGSGCSASALAACLKAAGAGVSLIFGSAAAINAAFGHPNKVGLNAVALDAIQHRIVSLFVARLQASFPDSRHVSAAARPTGIPVWIRILGLLIVSCASHRSQPGVPLTPLATSASVKQGVFAARSGRGVHASPLSAADGRIGDAISDEPRGDVIASLHCYSLMQSMLTSAVDLLDDCAAHASLMGTPERAQLLLAVAQHPLMKDPRHARQLMPRLCAVLLMSPCVTQRLLVRWWAEYDGGLLERSVVAPMQAFLTQELAVTKRLTIGVMNVIKVLSYVEQATAISSSLPPDAFYNSLISEKMDVVDHYTAWRQAHEMAAAAQHPRHHHHHQPPPPPPLPEPPHDDAPTRRSSSSSSLRFSSSQSAYLTKTASRRANGTEGPFSFCSYAFLLDAQAKRNLLVAEARIQMEQTVALARMELGLEIVGGRTGDLTLHAPGDLQRVLSLKETTPRRSDAGGGRGGGAAAGAGSSGAGSSSGGGLPSNEKRGGSGGAGRAIRHLLHRVIHGGRSCDTDGPRRPSSSRDLPRRASSQVSASPPRRSSLRPPVAAASLLRSSDRCQRAQLPSPELCDVPEAHSDMCILRVRRSRLVGDALAEIGRQSRRDLMKPLRVHFIGEEGIDAGGVKKEFFQLLVACLLSAQYGMLDLVPESRTYWFNPSSLEGHESFMLIGLVLGLAIYNRVLLDCPLPLALYKKLLGQPLGLRDLEQMSPIVGRSLRQLLKYDGPASVADAFCLTFAVDVQSWGCHRSVELIPGGNDVMVQEHNRHQYVELLVDWVLNRSISRQFESFAAGFRMLSAGPAMRLFNSQELERLVCGSPNLDFEALQRAASYDGGFTPQSRAVVWLWQIVQGLALSDKKALLKFFTGSDRAPIGGLGELRCIIQRDGGDSHKLPTSHTCFNTLLLPDYASHGKMMSLLQLAINNSEGFGLQ
ncbi:MAG: hypothetical protein WDW36_009655 [Sanguina aurantia]